MSNHHLKLDAHQEVPIIPGRYPVKQFKILKKNSASIDLRLRYFHRRRVAPPFYLYLLYQNPAIFIGYFQLKKLVLAV